MPTVGLMNWSVFQLLLLLGTLGLPVLAKWKDRLSSEIQISDYILTRPKLPPCLKPPTSTQCKSPCRVHIDCGAELPRCCHADCGNVCMHLEESGDAKSNLKISSVTPVVVSSRTQAT
ncbi:Wfdc16 [Phodopus roborovskii]|uniref:Wfdc16 protein n=1 Tax=Phodopus roborovskii TaxID=109678 RepID=A0AAU9YPA2_PHORO|nr:Wfdc16 [Phodopus roborovskii]